MRNRRISNMNSIAYVIVVVWFNIHLVLSRSLDQRRYRTAYACEGSILSLGCDSGQVINLVRANYGRFSITICNEHGDTDWSVNCMSNRSLRVLHTKCNQQNNCSILASTSVFGDPCPGTLKYLEAHYQCLPASSASSTARPRPPWFTSAGPSSWNTLLQNSSMSIPESSTTETTAFSTTTTSTTTTTVPLTVNETIVAAEASNETLPITTPSTTTTSVMPGPVIIEITEVTVMVPDFPGKATTKPTTTIAPHEEEHEELEEIEENEGMDENDEEQEEAEEDPTTPAATTTTRRMNAPDAKLPALPPNQDYTYCPPTVTRGLYWNWTKSGDYFIQPCPGGSTGYARWKCAELGGPSPAAWTPAAPDLSLCKSVWLTSLESRISDGDSVISVANDLAQVTSSKTLYGGDLAAAAKLLRQMSLRMGADLQAFPDFRQREAIVTELVQNVMRAGSNILSMSQSLAWRDLGVAVADGVFAAGSEDSQARHVATELLTSLEENAFLLANTLARQKMVLQAFDNILMSVRVLDSRNVIEDLTFPTEEEIQIWKSKENSISLPGQSLLENTDAGLIRVVLFAYEHMEDILSPYEEHGIPYQSSSGGNVTRIVNSRVISASLGKGRHIQLSQPITLTFQHLRVENVSNPGCVFWDYSVSSWSDEGCLVVGTNRTHTVCSCDHLTNFAILMDLDLSAGPSAAHWNSVSVIVYIGCTISLICLLLCLIHLIFFRTKTDRTNIQINFCLCLFAVELVFVSGIGQTQEKLVCGLVAGLLHFFFLSSVTWMFLEGFQIYVMLMEVFETEKSRMKWYYVCGYGLPVIIVAVSCVVDPLSYGTSSYCFLRADNYFIFSLVGPVIAILLADFVFLGLALHVLFRYQSTTAIIKAKEQTQLNNARIWIRCAFVLVFLLGLTWTFGLLYTTERSPAMSCLFTLLNSCQGLFILFFHCSQSGKVRKQFSRILQKRSSTRKDTVDVPDSNGKDNDSFFGNPNATVAPPSSTYWKGGNAADSSLSSGTQQLATLMDRSSNLRLSSRTLRASGRDQNNHVHHNLPNNTESGSFGGDGSSLRFFQTVPSFRSSSQPQPQHPGSVKRSLHPHPVPNPALAEGAALDAQLIAQFRSSQKRSVSPWNHTYTEIDPRSSLSYAEEYGFDLRNPVADPVYEEIERGRSHHFQQDSETSGQNSDVSRQSSRSYGDNRPLISLHHAHSHAPHDLLTTISYAFNSPQLRTKHSHVHQHPEPIVFNQAQPALINTGGLPHFVNEPADLNRTVPLRVSNKIVKRPNIANTVPYTEC